MTYDDILRAVVARLRGDAALTALLGGAHLYRAGAARAPQMPSLEYTVVSTAVRENTERLLVQFDLWGTSYAQVLAMDARLRALLHRDGPDDVGGVLMWLQFQDGRDHADPDPGVVHRSADYVFETHRET